MESGKMTKKAKIIIGVVISLCLLILVADIFYIFYKKVNNKEESNNFDSINAFSKIDSSYIAVGSNNHNDKAYEKGKITKYNEKYEKVWEKYFNRGYNSSFYNVALDGDNAVAIGGVQETKTELKENTTTALIVKYDKNGKELFYKTFQVLGNTKFKGIKVVEDGYIVVGQSIYENSTLGMSNEGGAIIIKYDKSGNVMWQHNYGGNKSGLYNDLVVTDQYIYAVGKNYGRVGIISQYSLNGDHIKTENYNYTDTLGFTGITKIENELFVVGAKKMKEDEYDHDIDALIVKYNENCEKLEEVTYNGNALERFNTVTSDEKNNLVIVGHQAFLDKEKSTKKNNVYIYNGLLAKYKKNLKGVYVEKYGENNNSYFTDVIVVEGSYLVSGYSKYKKHGHFSKFITYSTAGKVLGVK